MILRTWPAYKPVVLIEQGNQDTSKLFALGPLQGRIV
jgi:hypothetical protein